MPLLPLAEKGCILSSLLGVTEAFTAVDCKPDEIPWEHCQAVLTVGQGKGALGKAQSQGA